MENLDKQNEEFTSGATLVDGDSFTIKCKSCKNEFEQGKNEYRDVPSGCSSTREYQCPYCGTWQ